MTRSSLERLRPGGLNDRGMWTPSAPQAITVVLLGGMALTAAYISLTTNPMGVGTEVTTKTNVSVIDDGAVTVTVVEQDDGEPVEGATVIPSGKSVRPGAAPERISDKAGQVHFEFGDGADEITVDWSIGEQYATVSFEIDPPEGYVDRQSNADLTIERADESTSDAVESTAGTCSLRPGWDRIDPVLGGKAMLQRDIGQ